MPVFSYVQYIMEFSADTEDSIRPRCEQKKGNNIDVRYSGRSLTYLDQIVTVLMCVR